MGCRVLHAHTGGDDQSLQLGVCSGYRMMGMAVVLLMVDLGSGNDGMA
jgi:hypothetical protein